MQENQQGSTPVLISIQTNEGHGAGRSTRQILQEEADKWSFMFYNMGVKPGYRFLDQAFYFFKLWLQRTFFIFHFLYQVTN